VERTGSKSAAFQARSARWATVDGLNARVDLRRRPDQRRALLGSEARPGRAEVGGRLPSHADRRGTPRLPRPASGYARQRQTCACLRSPRRHSAQPSGHLGLECLADQTLVAMAPCDGAERRRASALLALVRWAAAGVPDFDPRRCLLLRAFGAAHLASRVCGRLLAAKGTVGVGLHPAAQFGDRNQPPAAAPDDPQLVHHMLLEEVDADPSAPAASTFDTASRGIRDSAESACGEMLRAFVGTVVDRSTPS
jgi:hypothetical protein